MSNEFLALSQKHNLQQDLINLVLEHAPKMCVDLNSVEPSLFGDKLRGVVVGERRTGNIIAIWYDKGHIDIGLHKSGFSADYKKLSIILN